MKYPTLTRILADSSLPNLGNPEQWEENFDQIRKRPAQRLGMEFKSWLQFRKPKYKVGKLLGDKDLTDALNLTPREQETIPAIWKWLLSRKVVKRSEVPEGFVTV